MLRLRFFASIRERLGCAALEFDAGTAPLGVRELVARLAAGPLPGCAEALLADNTIIAVNHGVAGREATVADGDEVAFYPPVTGG